MATPGVWPTMLQATKRGASILPLYPTPVVNPVSLKYYLYILPRAAFPQFPHIAPLSNTSPTQHKYPLQPHQDDGRQPYTSRQLTLRSPDHETSAGPGLASILFFYI